MMNNTQKKYPTIEKELKACHFVCCFFECIIYWYTVIIYSDHKNLIYNTATHTSQWVLCQCLKLNQDFGIKLVHIDRPNNGAADGLSKLDCLIKASNKTFRDIFNIEMIDWNSNNIFQHGAHEVRTGSLKTTQESAKGAH